MRLIAALAVVVLTGCTAVPVKRAFPEAPPILQKQCSPLGMLPEDTSKLSDMLTVVTKNYSKYHECQILLEGWQDWYKSQKKIFEDAN